MEPAFEIIAEPNRRAILSLLASSEQSVGEIERQLRMPQPTVSKHLRVLREAGFVASRTEAQRRLVARGARPVYVPDAVAWHYLHREFLDPQWVLRRAYRHGLEWGIRRTRGGKSTAIPVVRAALSRINAHTKGLILRLAGSEARRFEAAFHEAKWRGRWDGLWLGRRWDELPQLNLLSKEQGLARAA